MDAFLHRAASTLEIYERKLTVTESHVENLEKALELAQSRARSMNGLDARIAELEAALAASQHNYESAMSELEGRADIDSSKHNLVRSKREAQEKVEAAEALKTEAAQSAQVIQSEAESNAEAVVSSARTEAEEILRTALLAQTSILEEVEQMRVDAERTVTDSDLDQREPGAAEAKDLKAAQDAEAKAKAAQDKSRKAASKAKAQLKEATKRAADAEARAGKVEEELERLRSEMAAEVEARQLAGENSEAEADGLRRQVAQMRTALANIQERFSSAAKLSPEELELATALVDLDLHDVDLLVDLTTPSMTEQPAAEPTVTKADERPKDAAGEGEPDPDPAQPKVAIKSKWAQSEAVPAGALTEGRSEIEPTRRVWPETDNETPNWRDTFGSARREAAKKAAEEQPAEPLGFYERRLAGLRDRIRDAGVEPDS